MERLILRPSEETQLAKFLHARVVGQEQSVGSIVAQFDKLLANMNDPTRPIASLLFLGPTGVGKTKIVEAFCEYLFGEGQKPIKVNCGEYTHDHQIAKLIGSPAGYMGSDKAPFFARDKVENRRTKDGKQLNVILFDEIEKAGSAEHHGSGANAAGALNNLMLSIFDRGSLNLSNGTEVDFTKTIIFMTSNLGADKLIEAQGDEQKMKAIAEESARKFFNPEQFNRLDELVVFSTLTEDQIRLICDLEVAEVAERANMELDLDQPVIEGIIKMGYDVRYGARQLKRVVDRFVTRGLASLMATDQLRKGNRVRIEVDPEGKGQALAFFKMEGTAATEEVKPAAPIPVAAPVSAEMKYRSEGYVRRMLERKYRYGDSTGAKIFQWFKSRDFKPADPDVILSGIKTAGWTTDSANPIAMVKFVLHDWTKKLWAERMPDGRYIVKE